MKLKKLNLYAEEPELFIADYGGHGNYLEVNAATGVGNYLGVVTDVNIAAAVGDIYYNGTISDGARIITELSGGDTYDYLSNSVPVNQSNWMESKEFSLINNNVVVWRSLHYAVKDATKFDGSKPNENLYSEANPKGAYVLLPVSEATGYLKVVTP